MPAWAWILLLGLPVWGGLIAGIINRFWPEEIVNDAGYVLRPGGWWVPRYANPPEEAA